jgi:hypothetical protein
MTESNVPENHEGNLLPEIYPLIADALLRLRAKGTLVDLLCANRRIHELCLPNLMKTIELTRLSGFNDKTLAAFNDDGLKTGKLGLVRNLCVHYSVDWRRNGHILASIYERATNLECLVCSDFGDYQPLPGATLAWSLLLKGAIPIRKIIFNTARIGFVSGDASYELPRTLRTVKMLLMGSEDEYRTLFHLLDRLPHLEHLDLNFVEPPDKTTFRTILPFKRLVLCLRRATMTWPQHAELLNTDNAIESLTLQIRKTHRFNDNGASLWMALRGLKDLRKLCLAYCQTSLLVWLSSVPQINELAVYFPAWNLDEAGRRIIAELEGVKITFIGGYDPSDTHEDEIGFWKSLSFVEFIGNDYTINALYDL